MSNLCAIKECSNCGRYCRLHLVPKTPKAVTIKKESEKKKDLNKIYQKVRAEYLKYHPVCEFKECKEKARDIHHKAGKVGELFTDPNHFMACCREHHSLIELNPAWAKQQGYSISRLAKTK